MKEKNWLMQLIDYASAYKAQWYVSIVLSVLSVISGIVPYYCVYKIFIHPQDALSFSLIAVGFYAIKIIFYSVSTGLGHNVAFHVVEGLRLRLTDTFLNASLGDVQKYSIGEIKTVMVDKIENMEPPLAHVVPEGIGHIALPIVSIAALAWIDYRLALASLLTFPLAILMMTLTFKISGESFDKYSKSNTYMSSVIVEYIEGIEVIKAFSKTGVAYEKFSHAIKDYRKFVVEWLLSTLGCMKLAFTVCPATILGVGPMAMYLVNRGDISVAQVILAILLSMSMVTSLTAIEVYSENLRQIQQTCHDVQEFLDIPALKQSSKRKNISNHTIELDDVCFSYSENQEVLHHLNLTIPENTFTALVGPSGSGKSTIAKLIARFWDPTHGSIKLGGYEISDFPLNQLQEKISYVSQDNFLFDCSLMENIRLGNPDATDEEVMDCAKKAQCDTFIRNLEKGYETSAGEAGKRLSGGEKQRIAIARMMLKNSPIIILDEATAFTDPENEAKIQKSLSNLIQGKTVLVIAHRLSTIKKADQIVVLNHGSIDSVGTHEELLNSCSLYQSMWKAHIGVKNWAVGNGKEGV